MGLPLAALAARSLHSLSRRWAVLVPAGLVIVDAMTLPDPVLFVRERIESLRAMPRREPVPASALDLRLGARGGSATMTLDRPAEVPCVMSYWPTSPPASRDKLPSKLSTVRSDPDVTWKLSGGSA